MNEYQSYEFQAVDRPLSQRQMAERRALSTRATITPTRFHNVYHWGDFRGNPAVLMERYFDAFVCFANWGTHELMLRLLRTAEGQLILLLPTAHPYARWLARAAPGWQLPLPLAGLAPCDAHF